MHREVAVLVLGIIVVLAAVDYLDIYLKDEVAPELKPVTEPGTARIRLLGVGPEGSGVAAWLTVESKPGTGKILADIDELLFFSDVQVSIREAKSIAQSITGIDLNKVDLLYMIELDAVTSNRTTVAGPSAGAGLTIATIAAVEGEALNESITITGDVDLSGNILSVGGLEEKALAAQRAGISLFLIPAEQGALSRSVKRFKCDEFCRIDYIRQDVESVAGIPVREVSTIEEAYAYFKNEKLV